MKYVNLGCGTRIHPDWENVDFYKTGPSVRVHDLRKGVPYENEVFNAVYHSHLLEHFPKNEGKRFLRECYRVLRRGGIVRVAVPDLEGMVRVYLEKLEGLSSGAPLADDYDWMLLEMYDQFIREEPCGGFAEYVNRDPIPNWDFISKRWGTFADKAVRGIREAGASRNLSAGTKIAWSYVFRSPGSVVYNKLARLLLSKEDWGALQLGRFRRTGEVHMWMYDSYSLARLLRDVGFVEPQRVGPTESKIPGWTSFNLDADPDGQTYKADSIYMEAVKP